MTVYVVDAILRIVFLDEDGRFLPDRAVTDGINKAAKGQVIICLHRLRDWWPAGVVRADPHELQLWN